MVGVARIRYSQSNWLGHSPKRHGFESRGGTYLGELRSSMFTSPACRRQLFFWEHEIDRFNYSTHLFSCRQAFLTASTLLHAFVFRQKNQEATRGPKSSENPLSAL